MDGRNQGRSDRPLPAGTGHAPPSGSWYLPPPVLPSALLGLTEASVHWVPCPSRTALLTIRPAWLPPLSPLLWPLAISADSPGPKLWGDPVPGGLHRLSATPAPGDPPETNCPWAITYRHPLRPLVGFPVTLRRCIVPGVNREAFCPTHCILRAP